MAPNEANRKTQFMETALRIMDPCHAMGIGEDEIYCAYEV